MKMDAPIIPGKEAAGIVLGSPASDLLSTNRPASARKLLGCDVYEYPDVKIWADPATGAIDQVAVSGQYRGTTSNGLKIGMTLRDVAQNIWQAIRR